MNVNTEICKTFNAQAAQYEKAAIIQYEIGHRLFERLDYLKIAPKYILDLGCGPGYFTDCLKKKYPRAHVVSLDVAFLMLKQAKSKQRFWQKFSLVNGDMLKMPFATGIFDLVFANQVLHWTHSLSNVFNELSRVMNVNGCLMFSTLGPDTFREIKHAWARVDNHAHVNDFADMHDVGDLLIRENFLDPVVDMEILTAHYSSLSELLNALKSQGVRNINIARNRGLTGKNSWRKFELSMQNNCTDNGKYPLTYEVVYGQAWKSEHYQTSTGTETFVSIAQLQKTYQKNKNIL